MNMPTPCECGEICEFDHMKIIEKRFLCDECYEEVIAEEENDDGDV